MADAYDYAVMNLDGPAPLFVPEEWGDDFIGYFESWFVEHPVSGVVLKEDAPEDVKRIFNAIWQAEVQAALDSLVEQGFAEAVLDGEEMAYRIKE